MDKEYFVTDDTALAAFLHMKGYQFIPGTLTNRDRPGRKKFIMIDQPGREQLEYDFYMRTPVMFSPLEYHDSKVVVSRYLKITVTDPRPPRGKLVE